MSEMISCEAKLGDREILVDSLREIGVPEDAIQVHDTAIPIRAGRGNAKAHIVVNGRRIGMSYGDIGFELVDDGCKMYIDNMDAARGIAHKIAQTKIGGSGELAQIYMKNAVIKKLRQRGRYRLISQDKDKDKIRMRVSVL